MYEFKQKFEKTVYTTQKLRNKISIVQCLEDNSMFMLLRNGEYFCIGVRCIGEDS